MDDNVENPDQSSQPPQPAEEPSVEQDKDARKWAMFTHLSAFAGIIVPLGQILGPLILWLIKKDDFSYVDRQGKEALNFQISLAIYALAASPLICLAGLAAIVWAALAIMDIVFVIIASMSANDGKDYQYPLTIRLVK